MDLCFHAISLNSYVKTTFCVQGTSFLTSCKMYLGDLAFTLFYWQHFCCLLMKMSCKKWTLYEQKRGINEIVYIFEKPLKETQNIKVFLSMAFYIKKKVGGDGELTVFTTLRSLKSLKNRKSTWMRRCLNFLIKWVKLRQRNLQTTGNYF